MPSCEGLPMSSGGLDHRAARDNDRIELVGTLNRGDAIVHESGRLLVRAVVFDVGETLVDETREYGAWADWLGAPRLRYSAR
jgi:hypothetical protein